MILPSDTSEQARFLRELASRTVPTFDFYLFSLLAGVCLSIALLLDSPALVFLAALLAPFMAPMIGISLGTITGTIRFVLSSFGSLSIGSLIVFLCGMVAGWAVHILPQRVYQQAALHSQFTWPDFLVLLLGAGLTAFLIVRSPNQKPLVTSVAIAYELYLPAGVAGFGLTGGIAGMWQNGTGLFFTYLLWAALVGVLVFSLQGLYPRNAAGFLLGAGYALAGLVAAALLFNAQLNAPAGPAQANTGGNVAGVEVQHPTQTPMPVSSPTPIPIPTEQTATITPTTTVTRTLVEVLPDVTNHGGVAWVHIRMTNGKEGWIVRTLLRTATPAPGW